MRRKKIIEMKSEKKMETFEIESKMMRIVGWSLRNRR